MYKKLLLSLSLTFLIPLSVSALSVNLTADPHGSVSYGGVTGGTVIGTYVSGTRPFIRAVPDAGYTFGSWNQSLSGYSASYNAVSTSNLTAVAGFTAVTASPMTINNKCVNRILTYTTSTARPASASSAVTTAKVQIYVMEGSSFDFFVQDVSGYLASSPNLPFYYAYNAGTVGAGTYLGSNGAFVGNTSYLSMGSASLTSDVNYSCTSNPLASYQVIFTNNLPSGITATMLGAGTYKAHSKIILTASAVPNYTLDAFTGVCGNTAILSTRVSNTVSYNYNIDDLTDHCDIQAHYVFTPIASTKIYTITLTADPNGVISLNGSTGGTVTYSAFAGTSITISATPNSGYIFSNWSDAFTGQTSPYTFALDRDYNILASFKANNLVAGSSAGTIAGNVTYIADPIDGAGFLTGNGYSCSFPMTAPNACVNYQYNSDVLPTPAVTANDGWVFTGWTGNFATSTMTKFYNSTTFVVGEVSTISNPTLTAHFKYTGVSSGNVGVTFADPVSTSPTAIFDSTLTAPKFKLVCDAFYCHNEANPSPYKIDSKCVSQVITFTGNRVRSTGLGLFQNADSSHTYRLYALDGATFSYAQDTDYLYTFKSNPSNFIIQVDGKVLSAGQYSTDPNYGGVPYNTPFSGTSNSYTFRNVVPIDIQGYSCTAGQANTSTVAPFYIASAPASAFIDGYSYLPFIGSSFVNTPSYGSASSSMVTYGVNNSAIGWNFRRMQCSLFTIFIGYANNNVYCATKLSNNMPDYTKYSYMWVFTTEPIKAFYHQQSSDLNIDPDSQRTGLMVYKADQSIRIDASSTYSTSLNNYSNSILGIYASSSKKAGVDNIPFYATRINLNSCDYYSSARGFYNGNAPVSCLDILTVRDPNNSGLAGTVGLYGEAGFVNALNPTRNNGYFIDASSSDFTSRDVLFYGALLTSNGRWSISSFDDPHSKLNSLLDYVSNPDDVNQDVLQGSTSTVSFYTATSTTDGYYDAPVYHATSTTLATSTGGVITTDGTNWIHTFRSGTSTFSSVAGLTVKILVQGAGGGGGSSDTTSISGGGGGGRTEYNASYALTTSSITVVVGATSTADQTGAGSSFGSDFIASGGGGGAGSNSSHLNGYDGASGGGGGSNTGVGGDGTTSADNDGGNGGTACGGGGGGSGGDGGNCPSNFNGGAGGAGTSNSISGTSVVYGAGGGGAGYTGGSGGAGGTNAGSGVITFGATGGNAVANTGAGGGGGGYSGGAGGTGASGIVIVAYATTSTVSVDGYYDAPVYHPTSTINGFFTDTITYTPNASSTYTFTNQGHLYSFSVDSYSALLDTTIGVNSLASFTNDIYSRYDISLCYTSAVDFFDTGVIFCSVRNIFVKFMIFLFIPDSNQMKYFSDGLTNQIKKNGSPLSLAFSVPLRFANYGNLSWNPNSSTSPQLTLQLTSATSSRVVFTPANATQTALFTASDYSIYKFIDPIMSMILAVIVSMALFSLFS